MAHKAAAIKYIRQAKKRTVRNEQTKRHLGFLKKKTLKAVGKKDVASAMETYQALVQSVDKAAKRKILKKNTAARRKSRLMKKINSLKKTA